MIRSLVEPIPIEENGEAVVRRNLHIDNLTQHVKACTPVWIDIVDPTTDEMEWLQEHFQFHPLIMEDLVRVDRRPSLMVYKDYIFLSLFQPTIHRDKLESEEIHCLIGDFFFITVRREAGDIVEEAYDRVAQNTYYWERGITYFLYLTMQVVIDAYYPLLDTISNRLNRTEQDILEKHDKNQAQRHVYRVKQQLIQLRQMVAPQREVLSAAIGEERLTRTTENRDLFRHLYERLVRVYDIIDSQRDLSSNVLDLIQSQESAHLAEAVNRLTIFSMIFLPLTFLSGIFELNFITTEPELRIPIPGISLLGIILLLMFVIMSIMVWYFRRRGWL